MALKVLSLQVGFEADVCGLMKRGRRWVSHDSIRFCNLYSTVVEYRGVLCWQVIVVTRMALCLKKAHETRPNLTHITQKEVLRRVIAYGGSVSQFSVFFNALRCKLLHPAEWISEAPPRRPPFPGLLESRLSNTVPIFDYGQIYHFLPTLDRLVFDGTLEMIRLLRTLELNGGAVVFWK